MATDLNTCTFIGRLGRDPELKYSANGSAIANFSIAVNEAKKNAETGEYKDVAHWIDCIAFGKTAENISAWLAKGSRVAVNCRLQIRKWEDREGQPRKNYEFIVNSWQNLTPRDATAEGAEDPGASTRATAGGQRAAASDRPAPAANSAQEDFDDDIPF